MANRSRFMTRWLSIRLLKRIDIAVHLKRGQDGVDDFGTGFLAIATHTVSTLERIALTAE